MDNLPIALFNDFSKYLKERDDLKNIALGIDIREGERIKDLPKIMKSIEGQGFNPKLLFLDASDEVLVRRFSGTKHKHPLAEQISFNSHRQRKRTFGPIKQNADSEIKTSNLTLGELKEKISQLLEIKSSQEMSISVVSSATNTACRKRRLMS